MTSGNFSLIPVSQIVINREDRQRKELEGIDELAASIRKLGLIHPIVVTQDLVLVAGERRLEAHKQLGLDIIPAQFAEDLDEIELHLIELEENVKRRELDWQDRVAATTKYHELRRKQEGENWSQERSAEELGVTKGHLSQCFLVQSAIDEGVPEVAEAPKFSTAHNFAARRMERKKTSALRDLGQTSPRPSPKPSAESEGETIDEGEIETLASDRYAEIIEASFLDWSQQGIAEPYNFIHCDFPYGINAGDTKGQSAAKSIGGYEDKPEIYFELLDTMLDRQDNFIAKSAHMMFWFAMDFYEETRLRFEEAGWRVNPYPLVWFKSDNTGILPDANRGPRRVYETALICTRGDRKIIRAVGNCCAAPATKKYHMSEKNPSVLGQFFRMFIDETSVVLDPTCGSGNAVKVAEEMGANWATGIELNPDYATSARENLAL